VRRETDGRRRFLNMCCIFRKGGRERGERGRMMIPGNVFA